ncbi:cyclase family protein [Kribbella jiaozuonensis]|uniref:Cyclase family protein n=1 Tax=Kribbella jiaozuonensis TaxID=2575441 RepID=A0A4U3M350_9ACTN|nr:cyclase family protein [Kribbella jiaozuonensis]TKK82770.1 cyclase family protein [Kribbella jiaozuonensis]
MTQRGWQQSRGWGWVWGADDEIGALNTIDASSRLAALQSIKTGAAYDLGVLVDRTSFLASPHVGTEVVAFRTPQGLTADASTELGAPGVSFNTSLVVVSDHAGTQIDGLCHATLGPDEHWYNGATAEAHGRDFGPDRSAAHTFPPIIAPGVLIDVAAGVDELSPHYPITPTDLQDALRRQETEIRPGDVVLIRTGALRHWGEVGANHTALTGPDTAGLTLESARWLVEDCGAMLIGSDTSTVEVMPPVDGDNQSPVHSYLLVEQGVPMGELHYLEELAASRTYRFCYIALVPKLRGITAGFALRPVALA